jgi:hypothetical protein
MGDVTEGPYTRVKYDGKTVNARTRDALKYAQRLWRQRGKHSKTIRLAQGSYNRGGVSASAGTHGGSAGTASHGGGAGSPQGTGTAGTANTGGGGGGGGGASGTNGNGGPGGSGVVVVRYKV